MRKYSYLLLILLSFGIVYPQEGVVDYIKNTKHDIYYSLLSEINKSIDSLYSDLDMINKVVYVNDFDEFPLLAPNSGSNHLGVINIIDSLKVFDFDDSEINIVFSGMRVSSDFYYSKNDYRVIFPLSKKLWIIEIDAPLDNWYNFYLRKQIFEKEFNENIYIPVSLYLIDDFDRILVQRNLICRAEFEESNFQRVVFLDLAGPVGF